MAERRMFNKSICMSDDFLDMPITTRCLYFTFGLLADDDGFIDNPKSIMRQCGASKNDLDLLIAKQYVIGFDDGVVVIRHWRLHNYLRNDRYRETQYTAHKATLESGKQGYVRKGMADASATTGIPAVAEVDTEDRTVQDRGNLVQGSSYLREEGTMSTPEDETAEQVGGREAISPCPYQAIMSLYHEICVSYPRLRAISGNRRKAVSARWREYPNLETFRELFTKAELSAFLKGKNNRNWTANFDWMMMASSMAKILEGNYDNKNEQPRSSNPSGGAMATLQKLYEEADNE